MSAKGRISKEKGVQMCADMIYAGAQRKEIVRKFTETYVLSVSAVEKWMKAARVIVERRQKEDEAVNAKVRAEQVEEIARELGVSRKRIVAEWCKIAFLDIRKLYTPEGALKKFTDLDDETAGAIAGVEVFEEYAGDGEHLGTNRKLKTNPKTTALIELGKILGYTPQPGVQMEAKDERTGKSFKITLNL